MRITKSTLRGRFWTLIWGVLLVLVVLLVGWAIINKSTTVPEGQYFHGIVLGYTTVRRAINLLGEPDLIEDRGSFTVYRYGDRADLSEWVIVELWVDDLEKDSTVDAVYLFGEVIAGMAKADIAETNTLEQLILTLGRPNKVTWNNSCGRFLVWGSKGVAAAVNHFAYLHSGWNIRVNSLLFFEPMLDDQFVQEAWPWAEKGVQLWHQQTCIEGDSPDPYPEDPFDWEHMPTFPGLTETAVSKTLAAQITLTPTKAITLRAIFPTAATMTSDTSSPEPTTTPVP